MILSISFTWRIFLYLGRRSVPLISNKQLVFDFYKSSLCAYVSTDLFIKHLEISIGTQEGKKYHL